RSRIIWSGSAMSPEPTSCMCQTPDKPSVLVLPGGILFPFYVPLLHLLQRLFGLFARRIGPQAVGHATAELLLHPSMRDAVVPLVVLCHVPTVPLPQSLPMRHWLMKSEPNDYSIDDLERDGTTHWDGVRNYQARNLMRVQMSVGDAVLFYHSQLRPPGVVGLAEVVRDAYPDHTAWDPDSKYFDPK